MFSGWLLYARFTCFPHINSFNPVTQILCSSPFSDPQTAVLGDWRARVVGLRSHPGPWPHGLPAGALSPRAFEGLASLRAVKPKTSEEGNDEPEA